MDRQQLIRLIARLKWWFFLIKHDPEALVEVRKLGLGFLVCIVVLYGGVSLFLAPKQEMLAKKIKQKQEIEAEAPVQRVEALAGRIVHLGKEKARLLEERQVLALKVKYAEEHWQEQAGGRERFAKTVFCLRPDAPAVMEKRLKRMNNQPDRTVNGFAVSSINLGGEASFEELYDYLRYLERKPVVNSIENLTLVRLAGPPEKKMMVSFSMLVGSTSLVKPQ